MGWHVWGASECEKLLFNPISTWRGGWSKRHRIWILRKLCAHICWVEQLLYTTDLVAHSSLCRAILLGGGGVRARLKTPFKAKDLTLSVKEFKKSPSPTKLCRCCVITMKPQIKRLMTQLLHKYVASIYHRLYSGVRSRMQFFWCPSSWLKSCFAVDWAIKSTTTSC